MMPLDQGRAALMEASTHADLVLRLRDVVRLALRTGSSRDQILDDLESLRAAAPLHEDVILDVMDFVVGWATPHMSLGPAALGDTVAVMVDGRLDIDLSQVHNLSIQTAGTTSFISQSPNLPNWQWLSGRSRSTAEVPA